MKLSIIVPVYNAEAYLRPCLDSLLGQTIGDFEIILINDGSTDGSQSVIEEYKRTYPQIIRSQTVENGGQGRARNIGMELAQGDWLGFVDSDDWIDLRMYEKLYKAAQAENAEVAVCGILSVAEDGSTEELPVWQEGRALFAAGSVSNKLFKRSAVEGIRFPEGLWYEDFAFSANAIMRAEKTAFVEENLYFYRRGQTSTMNNNNANKNLDMLKIMEGLKGPMLKAGQKDGFEELLINHVLLETVKRLAIQSGPDKKAALGKIRGYVRRNIPNLSQCESFKKESRNRRLIMFLNYHGLEGLSMFVLRAKKQIS